MRSLFKKVVVTLLRAEARLVLQKYKPKIIAVTGSVGKTSAKDAIYAVMSQSAHVRKSQKSFNSEIGLPLTILGLPNAWNNPLKWLQNLLDGLAVYLFARKSYPEWLVLEVGADRPGDIKSLQKWLRVDVAVITRLPDVPVHVEFFESPEEVVEEKASLIDALRKDGSLVLYGDEENVRDLAVRAGTRPVLTYGFSEGCTVRATKAEVRQAAMHAGRAREWPVGMTVDIATPEATIPVEVVGTIGPHALLPVIAATAVGVALGRSGPQIKEGLQTYTPPVGRMHLVPGVKDTYIIDDTYNSSPAAAIAALETLGALSHRGGRKIAVMGDMMELGKYSFDAHREVGAVAAKAVDVLLTVGFRARDIAGGALDNGMPDSLIFQYEDATRAGKELELMLQEGDLVLVKGSQSMRMERITKEIMEHPEDAAKELVRQDGGWEDRV